MSKEKEIKIQREYDYFAFISYNSHDEKEATKLHRALKQWRLPISLSKSAGLERRPMQKLFFAPSDIVPKELEEALKENLRASEHLIVVCSPSSAKSEWVGFEIDYFCSLGRADKVHLLIVNGEPKSENTDTECFHPNLGKHFKDLLAANIHEKHFKLSYLNRQRAYVQLVASMLDLKFDSLWQSHRRKMIEQLIMIAILALVFVFSLLAVWQMNKPIDISLNLSEKTVHNTNLPPLQNAIVCFEIGENKFFDTISSFEDTIIFPNIASSLIGDTARLSVKCEDWFPIDTILFASKQIKLSLSRDESVYGKYKGLLYSSELDRPLANYPFSVEGIEFVTNSEGAFEIIIPLEQQKKEVLLKCDRCLEGLLLNLKMEDGNYIDVDYVE